MAKATAKRSKAGAKKSAKSSAKKSTAKKSTAKKSTAKKSTAKKSSVKKSSVKKSSVKKSSVKKSASGIAKKSIRGAKKVATTMHRTGAIARQVSAIAEAAAGVLDRVTGKNGQQPAQDDENQGADTAPARSTRRKSAKKT
jgi:hypothetical protein